MRSVLLLLALTSLGVSGCAGTPGAALPARAAVDPEVGEAIVFLRATGSAVDTAFREQQLPALRAVAEEQGVPLSVVEIDAVSGAPAEVAITPLLVYQNHRGRSIYQGRTTRADRFANFLRTSRYVPQGPEPLRREDVLVWRDGRGTVAVRLKVTDLTGSLPANFDAEVFRAAALAAVRAAGGRFTPAAHVDLGRADRTFYADYYPYRDAAGGLHVSVALYSQFNCDIPVFERLDPPVSGDFARARPVFQEAAAILEEAVLASIASPAHGDGFDTVPDSIPARDWDAVGLALPRRPVHAVDPAASMQLVSAWELPPPAAGDPPRLQFKFLPPLDYYSGEVTDVRCTLDLDPELTIASLRARVVANATTVTMGEEMLDDSLQEKDTLHTALFPEAQFVVERVEADPGSLAFGDTVTVTLSGKFTLRGKDLPLTTRATLEPIINASGAPRLLATGTFQIPLMEHFGIAGPDGPSPAKDHLRMHYRFELAPRG